MANLAAQMGTKDEFLINEGSAYIAFVDEFDKINTSMFSLESLADVSFSHTYTTLDIKETQSGNGNVALSLPLDKTVEVTLTLKNFSEKTLKLLMLGSSTLNEAATSKEKQIDIYDKDAYYDINELLDESKELIVQNEDKTTDYVLNTDYKYDDSGIIYITADSSIEENSVLTLTFDTVEYSNIQAFTQSSLSVYLTFNAISKADGKYSTVKIGKLSINPSDAIPFLSPDAEGTATITGKALVSSAYPELSPYSVKKR